MRRHGHPPLRIYLVHSAGQKPVHHSQQPLPPWPIWSSRPRLRSAAPAAKPVPLRAMRKHVARPDGRPLRARSTRNRNKDLIGEMGYHGALWASTGTGTLIAPNPPAQAGWMASRPLSSIKPNEGLGSSARPVISDPINTNCLDRRLYAAGIRVKPLCGQPDSRLPHCACGDPSLP
jgi:hypothetical protein